jgi:oligopeptidase A
MGMLRQLYFSKLDMDLHTQSTGEPDELRIRQTQQAAAAEYTLTSMPPLPEDQFLCSFSHIFAGGYAAVSTRHC